MGCLYKLTSPSGKSYIGITAKTLDVRWAKHIEHALGKRDNGALYAALRKYGPHTFVRETLAESDVWEELCQLERDAIANLNTFAPRGYNLTTGGEGIQGPRSLAARQRISAAQRLRFQRSEERARMAEHARKGLAIRWHGHVALPATKKRQQRALAAAERGHVPPLRQRKPVVERVQSQPRLVKVAKAAKVRVTREEHAARTRAAMARPEVHAKIVAAAQKRAADPAWRARIAQSKTGKKVGPCSLERKLKIAAARRREWADPVSRERRLAALAIARSARASKAT